MSPSQLAAPVQILLVEDSEGDVSLTREALHDARVANELNVVGDGVEAMAYLRRDGAYARKLPADLVLLDLNLPRKDGRQVHDEMKTDDAGWRSCAFQASTEGEADDPATSPGQWNPYLAPALQVSPEVPIDITEVCRQRRRWVTALGGAGAQRGRANGQPRVACG